MTGWILCKFRDRCALCGRTANHVWRHFISQTTSNMSVCADCADDLEAQ